MRISDLFRSGSLAQNSKSVDSERLRENRENIADKVSDGEDRVKISLLSRRLSRVSRVVAEDEEQQTERVAALKAKVSAGQYNVASNKIAKSVVDNFANF